MTKKPKEKPIQHDLNLIPEEAFAISQDGSIFLIFLEKQPNKEIMFSVQFGTQPILKLISMILELIPEKEVFDWWTSHNKEKGDGA